MAKAKQNSYINYELDFLEKKAKELKESVDAQPFHKLQDRMIEKMTARGTVEELAATIETQRASLIKALKDYAEIVTIINNLREKEEQKQINVRGNQDLSPFESGDI